MPEIHKDFLSYDKWSFITQQVSKGINSIYFALSIYDVAKSVICRVPKARNDITLNEVSDVRNQGQ